MKTSRTGSVPSFLGADLTDRYARSPRPIDVCGLGPRREGGFDARFWTWTWDAAPAPLGVEAIAEEILAARVTMLDGPQGLALPPGTMRVCERQTGAPGHTPHVPPALDRPFSGFVRSGLDLFGRLHGVGVPISPAAGQTGCGEVYPGDMWTSLIRGLAKKDTPLGRVQRRAILELLGVHGLPALPSHDESDAAVGALAAAALDGAVPGVGAQLVGGALVVDGAGTLREGPMVRLVVVDSTLRQALGAVLAS